MAREKPAVAVEVISDAYDLGNLTGEWSALWRASGPATPFQTPEWLLAWWKHFGNTQLRTIALRSEGRLVALAPLFIVLDKTTGWRELKLIGTGITDYLDILAAPGFEESCIDAIYWLAEKEGCETCDFQQLRKDSLLIRGFLPKGWVEEQTVQTRSPVLELQSDISRVVPKDVLMDVINRKNDGGGHIEQAALKSFDQSFWDLLRLREARWLAPGQIAHDTTLFYRDALFGLLARGVLRLYGWRIRKKVVASLLGFEDRHRFYLYLTGFDWEFRHLNPDNVLVAHAIQEAIRNGDAEFDFLRGVDAYKYQWGAKDQLNYRRRIYRPPDKEAKRQGAL